MFHDLEETDWPLQVAVLAPTHDLGLGEATPTPPGNKRVYHCRPRISIKWDRDLSGYTIPFLIILKSKSLTWPHETAVVDGTESWRGVTPY